MDVKTLKHWHELLLGFGFFIFVLLVNHLIITESPIYFEQPPLYLANQKIHSFADLLNIYLHPEMLYMGSIPYFRPSGHFLMYQLLMPLLGWHNIKGLIIVNLFFLALTGYFMMKLYQTLFPKLWLGAAISFTVFMMHPALALSRFMVMQFDYNYALFTILAIYCFVLFCQKNNVFNNMALNGELLLERPFKQTSFRFFPLLFLSLIFYSIAITFKESAIMAMPVFLCYFLLCFCPKFPLLKRIRILCSNKQALQILILLFVISITLATYISMQWSQVQRPCQVHRLDNYIYYLRVLLGDWTSNKGSILYGPNCILFSPYTLFIWWGLCVTFIITSFLLFSKHVYDHATLEYKKSLLLLGFSSAVFLLLPLLFGGFSWHLMLTILFFSLALGFGFEYFCQHYMKKKWCYLAAAVLIFIIGVDTVKLNEEQFIKKSPASLLTRNAVLNPPPLQHQLNENSVLVVEDSVRFKNYLFLEKGLSLERHTTSIRMLSYYIGDSIFPFKDRKSWLFATTGYFLKPDYIYSGTVFRWAYLLPHLQEEVYPFRVEEMAKVPDDVIYRWLQHFDNIYAVGYDEQANWHDITQSFKKNLNQEKIRRHLILHQYTALSKTMISGKTLADEQIPLPNPHLCQLKCDKDSHCDGFVLMMLPLIEDIIYICEFNKNIDQAKTKPCPMCVSYIKKIL